MDADWSVELGAEDETLGFPWYASEQLRWLDLKNHPEVIPLLTEVSEFPQLAPVLAALNVPTLPLHTAKCDVWFEDQLVAAEDVYESSCRLSCYVDVLFTDERRCSFESHEAFAKEAARRMSQSADIPACVEFVIRRCYFARTAFKNTPANNAADVPADNTVSGFYISVYVSGYGKTRDEALSCWASALAASVEAVRSSAESLR